MEDTFAITIAFIVLSTLIAAFVKKRKEDKCLKDFEKYMITLEKISKEMVKGVLNVENTGMEFFYKDIDEKSDLYSSTYIFYKYEFADIQSLIRYHDELSEEGKKKREKVLKRTYQPGFFRRMKRRIQNIFKTIRDALMEVVNLLMSQAKKTKSVGKVMESQDKYVNQMKGDVVNAVSTAYEPLLEKYIGKKVVFEMIKEGVKFKYQGILKEYTADFIEFMDVNYKLNESDNERIVDLIIPRKNGVVRHSVSKLQPVSQQ